MPFLFAITLVLIGAMFRVVPHPLGFAAVGVYSGARLPTRWSFLVPIGTMALSDLPIGRFSGLGLVQGTGYVILGLVTLFSRLIIRSVGPTLRIIPSVGASALFFRLSNAAVWAGPFPPSGRGLTPYPTNAVGLLARDNAARPFSANGLVADLLGFGLLSGAETVRCWSLATCDERQVLPMWISARDGRRRG